MWRARVTWGSNFIVHWFSSLFVYDRKSGLGPICAAFLFYNYSNNKKRFNNWRDSDYKIDRLLSLSELLMTLGDRNLDSHIVNKLISSVKKDQGPFPQISFNITIPIIFFLSRTHIHLFLSPPSIFIPKTENSQHSLYWKSFFSYNWYTSKFSNRPLCTRRWLLFNVDNDDDDWMIFKVT